MAPEEKKQSQATDSITIGLGFDQLIQRVDTNITQELFVTTADKARLCLMDALDRMERRKAWMVPAGILATLVVVLPTTGTFQDFLGVSKEFWKALISLAAIGTFGWLCYCLVQIRNSLTIGQIVDRLRTDSLTARPEQPQLAPEQDSLTIIEARYGFQAHQADVTGALRRAINGNALHVTVGNQLAGDPCPNFVKSLQVKYRYKGKENMKTIVEGTDLDLPDKTEQS